MTAISTTWLFDVGSYCDDILSAVPSGLPVFAFDP
jgi:hypothetical protein